MLTADLQQRIGQFFLISFEGVAIPAETVWLLQKRHVGGVVLFKSNCPNLEKIQELLGRLQSLSTHHPLCLALDHEGGSVHRLPKEFTHFPPMASLGKLYERMPSSNLSFGVGLAMGRELAQAGFHLNFAPVLDVHTNPSNPVIGDRAFSSDPEVVSLAACQLIDGLQEAGVGACGKHFPGHGDTDEDSHAVLPSLPHNRKRLDSLELVPFEAAIQQNVAAIMTAHVVYNGIDKNTPATFSVKILRDILREELGFSGVIISDDLSMGAIAKQWPLEEACVCTFLAGCDWLLVGKDPKKQARALDYFARALEEGRIPLPRVEEALKRIADFKKRFCKTGVKRPNAEVIGCPEHKELLSKIKQLS